MPFCRKCGNELLDVAAFCSECGAPVKQADIHVDKENKADNHNTPILIAIVIVLGVVLVAMLIVLGLFMNKDYSSSDNVMITGQSIVGLSNETDDTIVQNSNNEKTDVSLNDTTVESEMANSALLMSYYTIYNTAPNDTWGE